MSTATSRLRRVGVGGLATAIVLGTALTGAGTANAWLSDPVPSDDLDRVTVTAGDMTLVSPGRTNQPVAPVTIGVDGWQAGDTLRLSLTVDNPEDLDCTTATQALGFSSPATPIIRAARTATANAGETNLPAFSAPTADPGGCIVPGVTQNLVITFTNSDAYNDTSGDITTPADDDGPGSVLNISNILAYVGADLRGPIALQVSATGTAAPSPVYVANVVAHTTPATTTPTTGRPGATIPAPAVTVTEPAAGVIHETITFRLNAGSWANAGTLTPPSGVTVTSSGSISTDGSTLTYALNGSTTTPGTFTLSGASITLPGTHRVVTVNADGLGAVPYASAIAQGRIYGDDRYATAADAFRSTFTTGGLFTGPGSVVLATGTNFPDALAANALAGQLGTGILLTRPNALPAPTREALIDAIRFDLSTVYVVGGENAISQAIVEEIRNMGLNPNIGGEALNPVRVIRVSGADRTKTAEAVASYVDPDPNVTVNTATGPTAIVSSGWNYPDALAIGPASWAYDMPLFLTQRDGTLSNSTLTALEGTGATNVIIVGGENAVPAAVATQLGTQFNVLRLSGADRYDTAAAIASWELKAPDSTDTSDTGGLTWGADDPVAYLATGNNFPDALAGGPVAGYNASPIFLVPMSEAETGVLIEYTADVFSSVTPFGGTSVVSNDARNAAAVATAGVPNQLVGAPVDRDTRPAVVSAVADRGSGIGDDAVLVHFSESVGPAATSFDAAQFDLYQGADCTGTYVGGTAVTVSAVDGDTLRVSGPGWELIGPHSLRVEAAAVQDLDGDTADTNLAQCKVVSGTGTPPAAPGA